MAVAYETILKKMMTEVSAAKAVQHKEQDMKQHVANVRLLCDLLLEEQTEHEQKQHVMSKKDISEAEWKAMLGSSTKPQIHSAERMDHDEANGDSIFDF